MAGLTLIVVGFFVATAVVIALARASTARWEHDKRAVAAVRDDVSARRTSSAGTAFRIPRAMTRWGVTALRTQTSRFLPRKLLARLLPTDRKRGTSRARPIRRLVGVVSSLPFRGKLRAGRWKETRPPALPVDRERGVMALDPKPSRAATDVRTNGVARNADPKLLRPAVPGARRRALAFLHRHQQPQDVRIPHEERNETPTAH